MNYDNKINPVLITYSKPIKIEKTVLTKAGNHYHKEKEELFYCLSGQVSIILQHIDSKKREEIKISASENKIVFIPKMTGHVIVSKAPNTTFLVIASRPSVEGDEFLYKVI